MIALPPVDPADYIMMASEEMQKCINKYFNEITLEQVARAEPLETKFAPEMLDDLLAEYRACLERVWDSMPLRHSSSFAAAYRTPSVEAAGDLDALREAYQAALKRTPREKRRKDFTDVMAYKLLLQEYGERLLRAMHARFVDAVAEIL